MHTDETTAGLTCCSAWPNPTGTWTGGYFQARLNESSAHLSAGCGRSCLLPCQTSVTVLFGLATPHALVAAC